MQASVPGRVCENVPSPGASQSLIWRKTPSAHWDLCAGAYMLSGTSSATERVGPRGPRASYAVAHGGVRSPFRSR